MPSSSATARTSSGATMLALSGPFENTMITLRPGTLAASRKRQQQAVIERGIVARHGFAQAEDRFAAVVIQGRGTRQIAAEGIDRDGVGAVQSAHEIGDGIGGVNKPAIHVVAGIEQHEDVGADEGIGADLGRGRAFLRRIRRWMRADGRVVPSSSICTGGLLPSPKVLIFCGMPSSVDPEIARLQAVDVVVLAVGDGEAQHHHVDFDAESGPLLRPDPSQSTRSCQSRPEHCDSFDRIQ